MTCKDCLHCEACTDMIESLGYTVGGDGFNAEVRCKCFSDRSEWVHLPCKVGDTVYFIELEFNDKIRNFEPKIHRTTVKGYTVNARYILYHTRKGNDFTDSMLGKTVFLTREEAEKALEGETK